MFGQNELWLKASVIYHMHLIAALSFNWSKLPVVKYMCILSFALLASRDERVTDISYTGKARVTDVWGAPAPSACIHLPEGSGLQKTAHTRLSVTQGRSRKNMARHHPA